MRSRHYDGMNGFYGHLRKLADGYERDKLANQPVEIRVYCEAAGMMPQLARVCAPYSVPVYSCSGFDSLTARHDLARACHDNAFYQGRSTVVLHLGDWDPSGVSIFEILSEAIESVLDLDILRADREAEARERRQIARALPGGAS